MTRRSRLIFRSLIAVACASRSPAQSDYNEAVAKTRTGDWAAACRIASRLVETQPKSYAGHNLMGLCAARNGDREAAEKWFRNSIALKPDFADSRNNLGIELVRADRNSDAVAQFQAALRADPKNVTALYNAGRIELDAGNHQSAMRRLSAAATLAPGDLPVRLALAEGLALTGQELRARNALEGVLRERPALVAELMSLARANAVKGKYANARAILAGIDPPPRYAAEWNAISGYADYKLGNPRRAGERLRRALELDPSVDEYWMNMAELLLFHHSFDVAIAFFEVGLGKLPESAPLHLGMGVSRLSVGGQDEEGIRHLETALQLRPDFEPALSALCAAYHRNKDWRQLEQTAARWLKLHPQAFAAFYYRALITLDGGTGAGIGRLAEARRLLLRSIEIEPRFAPSRIAMGKLLNELDRASEGLAEFQAAVEADPEDRAARYQLAITYRKLGELEKSRQALETFQKLKANNQPWKVVFQVSKDKR